MAAYKSELFASFALISALGLLTGCQPKQQPAQQSTASPALPNPPSTAPELYRYIGQYRDDDLVKVTRLAELASNEPKDSFSGAWRSRFRFLHAQLLLAQSDSPDLSGLLDHVQPNLPAAEQAARKAFIRGLLAENREDFAQAEKEYNSAEAGIPAVNSSFADPCWTSELLAFHQPNIFISLNQPNLANNSLAQAEPYTNACPDKFWQIAAAYNSGRNYSDLLYYYEKSNQYYNQCVAVAHPDGFRRLEILCLGGIALNDYNLGNYDKALTAFDEVDKTYKTLSNPSPDTIDAWAARKGHLARTYAALHRYDEAAPAYLEAIKMVSAKRSYLNRFQTELTSVYIDRYREKHDERDYQSAQSLNDSLRKQASFDRAEFATATFVRLNAARLAHLKGDLPGALSQLDEVKQALFKPHAAQDPKVLGPYHNQRAQILAAMNRIPQARAEFDAALAVTDSARGFVTKDENKLSTFTRLRAIYQTYVNFLASHNQPSAALRIAEQGHARLLAEKLHATSKPLSASSFPRLARAKNAVILSYSISPDHSYLWVTTSKGSTIFDLHTTEPKLTKLINRHNDPITSERSIDEDLEGSNLYNLLIQPAAALIPAHARVIIIPDGPLSYLNFETLIPPGPTPHYWLESITISIAPSLTLLEAKPEPAIHPSSVLAVGDTPQVEQRFPALGGQEIHDITQIYGPKVFPLVSSAATPDGFKNASPSHYSLIHFSNHALANSESPLDSFLVLADDSNRDHYLYAHDLQALAIKADLVTLSACQSAGGKNIPGEGIVGLTWAVLSGGTHNVIASLWSVSALYNAPLMNEFYKNLNAGHPPAQALHLAKLTIAAKPHSTPYQWAAFQLYSR